jgi:glycosyltransferase involved in cell wall biosynthesis
MQLNFGAHRWLWYDGYGRMCLSSAQALLRRGHDVHPFELRELDRPSWFLQAQGLDFSRVTLQFAPPQEFHHLPGRSVSFTMHESTNLPKGWADHINQKSQLCLVPHEWLVPVLQRAGVKVPIEVVLSGVDPEECPIIMQNHHRPFTFGCLADRGFRKGFDKVWTAFYKVFSFQNKDVRLILKCRPGSLPALDYAYSTDSRLVVWKADVEHVADIFAQMDAFMFPSRCEGWGQPPRESAACGIPTVVTRWSGLDDETDQWAIPLEDYKLVDSGMEGCGGQWAEPSLDELCEQMEWIYKNQDVAKQQALKSAEWLRQNRTFSQMADNIVKTMNAYVNTPPPPDEPTGRNVRSQRVREVSVV